MSATSSLFARRAVVLWRAALVSASIAVAALGSSATACSLLLSSDGYAGSGNGSDVGDAHELTDATDATDAAGGDASTEGGCVAVGTSAPFVVDVPAASAIAVDAVNAYWIDGVGVRTCPLAGCVAGAPRTLAAVSGAHSLTATMGSAYWIRDNALFHAASTGDAGASQCAATIGPATAGLGSDSSRIYFGTHRAVLGCDLDCASCPYAFIVSWDHDDFGGDIVPLGGNPYATALVDGLLAWNESLKGNQTALVPTTLTHFALLDGYAYWTNSAEAKVGRTALTPDAGAETLFEGQTAATGIAVDLRGGDEALYWTTAIPGGAVLRKALVDATPQTIACDQGTPTSIAVTATGTVLWTNASSNEIMLWHP